VDPVGDDQKDNLNGVIVDNPLSPVTAEFSIKRSINGTPLLLPNGNLAVTYEVLVENTGTADLADILLTQDLAGQVSSALEKVGSLILASAPKDAGSGITLNNSWDGISSPSLVEPTAASRLAVGDSFAVRFSAEIDAEALGLPRRLETKNISGSEAVVENIVTAPAMDSQQDVSSYVVTAEPVIPAPSSIVEDNRESSDGPTLSPVANISIRKAIVAAPVLTDRGNHVVAYQLTIKNTGSVDLSELSLLEDLSTQFGRSLVRAGNLTVVSDPSDPISHIVVDSAGWNGKVSTELLDGSATNVLVAGDSFTIEFEVEVKAKKAKSPKLGKAGNLSSLNSVDRKTFKLTSARQGAHRRRALPSP
jgi:hypothetical protein